jgi:hypothetical protein
MVKDEDGNKTYTHCNIVGTDPFNELNLNTDIIFAKNIYIFYIEEKNMVYSEATKQDEIEYSVKEWDILYPIRRNTPLALFNSNKYITEKDIK